MRWDGNVNHACNAPDYTIMLHEFSTSCQSNTPAPLASIHLHHSIHDSLLASFSVSFCLAIRLERRNIARSASSSLLELWGWACVCDCVTCVSSSDSYHNSAQNAHTKHHTTQGGTTFVLLTLHSCPHLLHVISLISSACACSFDVGNASNDKLESQFLYVWSCISWNIPSTTVRHYMHEGYLLPFRSLWVCTFCFCHSHLIPRFFSIHMFC